MAVHDRGAGPHGGGRRLRDRVRNVMQLQVEEDVRSRCHKVTHKGGPRGDEALEPDLENARLWREETRHGEECRAIRQVQRDGEPRAGVRRLSIHENEWSFRGRVRSVPTRSETRATPWLSHHAASSPTSRPASEGSRKFAVPIWTAFAPATRNSTACSTVSIPPIPKIGIFGRAVRAPPTMRSEVGGSGGPESPPVVKPIFGSRRSRSIARPTSVLMSESASAPASTAARADATMSVTFGESFTTSGWRVAERILFTRAASASGLFPKTMPPLTTFGQETFTSTAATRRSWPMRSTTAT